MKTYTMAAIAALMLSGAAAPAAEDGIQLDPALTPYARVEGVAGSLNSVGSDTLNNLMTYWAESFRKFYPNVNIQVEGKGSSTAAPALAEGTAQLGPMSRPMKLEEIEQFEARHGFRPTQLSVALDSLGVFVHKDNPVQNLSLAQLDAIFSKTRKRGNPADILTWGDAGVTDPAWAALPISLYGRNSASGTYGFFKEHVLAKGDFKDTVKEQPGSASVVMGITEDRAAIGYSGIGYRTSGVKTLAISKTGQDTPYAPSQANVLANKYPLSRMLYVYIAKKPNEPLDPLTREFITFIFSKEGQESVVKDGFYPLPAKIAGEQLRLIQ